MKNAIIVSESNYTTHASGYVTLQNAFTGSSLIAHIEELTAEAEKAGIHSAKTVVRVSTQDEYHQAFTATLFTFLTDGAISNYTRAANAYDWRIEELIRAFNTSGDISFKVIETKMSAPVKAVLSDNNVVHQTTFVFDTKKFIAGLAEIAEDPLSEETYVAGYGIYCKAGAFSTVVYVDTVTHIEYTIHDRPMKTFVRKNL